MNGYCWFEHIVCMYVRYRRSFWIVDIALSKNKNIHVLHGEDAVYFEVIRPELYEITKIS